MRHGALQLQRLVDRSLHKGLDFGLPESGQRAASEAPRKTFGPRKAYAVALVGSAVETFMPSSVMILISSGTESALVVVVTKDGNDGEPQTNQRIHQLSPFLRLP